MAAAVVAGEVLALVVALGAVLVMGWYDTARPARSGAAARLITGVFAAVPFAAMAAMVLLALYATTV